MTLERAMALLGCAGLLVLAAVAWLTWDFIRLLSQTDDEPGGAFDRQMEPVR